MLGRYGGGGVSWLSAVHLVFISGRGGGAPYVWGGVGFPYGGGMVWSMCRDCLKSGISNSPGTIGILFCKVHYVGYSDIK